MLSQFTSASLVCIVACTLLGCSAVPIPVTIPIRTDAVIEKGTAVEGAVAGVGVGELGSFDITNSQAFRNENVRRDHVKSARITRFDLDIEAPEGQNFDFLEQVTFSVEAPGLDRKRVASATVPRGASRISCDIDRVDLAPYVRANSMAITTEASGRRPDVDTTISLALDLRLETTLLPQD